MRRGLVLALLALTAFGREGTTWFVEQGGEFDLYSEDLKRSQGVLRDIEYAKFLIDSTRLFPVREATARRAVILAFATDSDFAKYRLGLSLGAYFITNGDFEAVVLGPQAQRDARVLVHEYVHVRVNRAGWRVPAWFNEGLAEYFSTMRYVDQSRLIVGEPPPAALRQLRTAWVSFSEIVAAGTEHATLAEAPFSTSAYSECWAAVHMLMSVDPWRGHVADLASAFSQGLSTEDALLRVFHVSTVEFERALLSYVKNPRPHLIAYDASAQQETPSPAVRAADSFEVQYSMAAAILDPVRRTSVLKELTQAYPARPEPHEALAAESLNRSDLKSAETHLRSAFENASTNINAIANYSKLLLEEGDPMAQRVMDRLLLLAPNRDDVKLIKARWLITQDESQQALATLDQIRVPPAGAEAEFYASVIVTACALRKYDRAETAFELLGKGTLAPGETQTAEICSDVVEK